MSRQFRPRRATMLAFRPAPLGGGGWNGEEESGASIQRKIQGLYAKGGKGCQNLGKPLQNIDHAGDHSHVNHDSVASMQPVVSSIVQGIPSSTNRGRRARRERDLVGFVNVSTRHSESCDLTLPAVTTSIVG